MTIVVGLGNPKPEYSSTRHNVGFLVVEELSRRLDPDGRENRRTVWIERATLSSGPIVLARPRTYMNRSGRAVRELLEREEVGEAFLLVVCDDLNLPLGTIRLRPGGSHGGHNGLRSIIDQLGTTEFARLRIGVGPVDAGVEHADHVLGTFSGDERRRLPEIVERAADCVLSAIDEGLERAMSRYNTRPAEASGGDEGTR